MSFMACSQRTDVHMKYISCIPVMARMKKKKPCMTEAEGRLEDFPREVCSCVFIHKKAILDRAALDTALLVGMVLTP